MTNKEILVETTGKFFVQPDGDGALTIWDNTDPVRPRPVAVRYGHLQRVVATTVEYGPLVWQVLTSVLTADEATVERLAETLHSTCYEGVRGFGGHMDADQRAVNVVLAALRAPADPEGGAA